MLMKSYAASALRRAGMDRAQATDDLVQELLLAIHA